MGLWEWFRTAPGVHRIHCDPSGATTIYFVTNTEGFSDRCISYYLVLNSCHLVVPLGSEELIFEQASLFTAAPGDWHLGRYMQARQSKAKQARQSKGSKAKQTKVSNA